MVAGLLPAVTMLNKGYGHQDFHPIYKEAEALNVPLTVHGAVSRGLGFDFLQTMSMIHTLEHPLAQMIQLTSVVLDGVFDLFPKLRIGFLEAGAGWIPYMMDRMDDKFHIDRKRKHFPLSIKPSEYFKTRQHLRHLRDRRKDSRRRRPRARRRSCDVPDGFSPRTPSRRVRRRYPRVLAPPGFIRAGQAQNPQRERQTVLRAAMK